jgi:hypothetical protein
VNERRVLWLVRGEEPIAGEDAPVRAADDVRAIDSTDADELVDAIFAADVVVVW